ncbi:Lar family restriction alleviation protein [Pseudomonas aeruginosa]|uniref:Lar family restriction alleviation protein n=1 Tax=Pseudomonas aeruginosa TaxID=287 RepID=UPI001A251547|nr:Lar family restriction alleviation protein [Pseudomonas aeruginosa]HCF5184516.1 Lar family restriction alleviation protein [Pseudomonas aeruginosa]HDU9648110.1 Lar family restriction alleviation protein [Pseudomonas aeruginosa]HEJ2039995.1 Lar family restriction alleviation protein [Pseudomonas aeruginosa]
MAEELKPCPCCGGEAAFVELEDGGIVAVCASKGCVASGVVRYACGDEPRPLIAETWNTRSVPAGHVVVPRELLERIRSQLDLRAEFDQTYPPETQPVNDDARLFLELRALLSEQEGGNDVSNHQ